MTELNENYAASLQEEREKSDEIARIKISELGIAKEIETPLEISGLGKKIAKLYSRERRDLAETFGDELPKILAAALHEYLFACWSAAATMQQGIDDKSVNDNEYTRRFITGPGYADEEGWANTLSNGFATVTPTEARKKCIKEQTGLEILDPSIATQSMAVLWLYQASIEMAQSNIEQAFDLVHEAEDALKIDWGVWMWDQGSEYTQEASSKKARSDLARKAALAAHAETHAMKAEIKDFWMKNISPSISNDAASALLIRQFPLNPRTLSRYVSEFKNAAG